MPQAERKMLYSYLKGQEEEEVVEEEEECELAPPRSRHGNEGTGHRAARAPGTGPPPPFSGPAAIGRSDSSALREPAAPPRRPNPQLLALAAARDDRSSPRVPGAATPECLRPRARRHCSPSRLPSWSWEPAPAPCPPPRGTYGLLLGRGRRGRGRGRGGLGRPGGRVRDAAAAADGDGDGDANANGAWAGLGSAGLGGGDGVRRARSLLHTAGCPAQRPRTACYCAGPELHSFCCGARPASPFIVSSLFPPSLSVGVRAPARVTQLGTAKPFPALPAPHPGPAPARPSTPLAKSRLPTSCQAVPSWMEQITPQCSEMANNSTQQQTFKFRFNQENPGSISTALFCLARCP
ncbi:bcl-2-binding component 3-like [Heterocephalus glaber]|uniref:Bcl-2-binding component 3-like n=1 Tax=Heterocephalus glaber TaxID=10181 RepID=A0AAX6RHV7_HETGA|nr:bcl-2-binding component 3-like [Heterocephalus glaber]